jgi:uncharacterized delta-60 repeat protein
MAMRAGFAARKASYRYSPILAAAALLAAGTASAAPGELDNSFGTAGRASVSLGSTPSHPIDAELYATALQADGKVVLAGSVQEYRTGGDYNRHILIARLNTNGSLDTTFDGDGWTTIDIAGADSTDKAYAVVVQSDGKIVAAGTTQSVQTSHWDVALVRLNTDGSLDTGFGTGGKVLFDAGGTTTDEARGIVRRASDGRLIIAGSTDRTGSVDMLFAAFTSSGQPDSTFGTDGVTLASFGPDSSEYALALAQQTDGALVASGVGPGSSFAPTMAVARLTATGALDTTFSEDGLIVIDFGLGAAEGASVAIQSDGKIVVAGSSNYDFSKVVLARLTTDGALDTTFNGTGTAAHDLRADWDYEHAVGVAVQADGKIVVGGEGVLPSNTGAQDLFVARYTTAGALDTTFGNLGIGIADFGRPDQPGRAMARAVLIQSDGRIVVAGEDGNVDDTLAIARFDSSGGGSAGVISFVKASSQYAENSATVTIPVRRTGGATGAAVVSVRVGPGMGQVTAGTGCDFNIGTLTLTWPDGDYADKLVSVTIVDDTWLDYDYFSLELYGATGAVIAYPKHDITVSDSGDTEQPTPGAVAIEAEKTVNEGAGSVTLTVTRTSGSDDCAIATFQTMDGSGQHPALAGSDYAAAAGVVQFNDGDTASKQITIPIINDTVGEADEQFGVQLNTALSLLHPYGSVTIVDNDGGYPGEIAVESDGSDSETDGAAGGPISFVRAFGSNGAVSVRYEVTSGTATAGTDFLATSGTVNWAAGDTSTKQIFVEIVNDTAPEPNETYLVTISDPTGGAVLANTQTTQTIYDNDTPARGAFSCYVAATTNPAHEGVGLAKVLVKRQDGRDGSVTVDYSTEGGSATSGADFTAVSGTLSWSDQAGCLPAPFYTCTGQYEVAVDVPIADDATPEDDETFALKLANPTGGATLATASCDVRIYRNDSPNGAISISPGSMQVSETGGTATVSVTRIGGTQGVVTADYRTIGSVATSGTDFTAVSGTFTWADGEGGTKTITVPILDDAAQEGSEDFFVLVGENITGGAILDYQTCSLFSGYCFSRIFIIDDEGSAGSIVTATAAGVVEAAGSVTVNLSRVSGTAGAASVNWSTVPGTAQPPGDYTTSSGTVSWASGEGGLKSIVVPIANDTVGEPTEAFTVHYTVASGSATLNNTDTTVTITDDDDPGDIAMTLSAVSVSETATTLTITANRSTGTTGEVRVDFATSNGTATAGSDYTAKSGQFIWANGETGPKSTTIAVLDDSVEEPDETFAVTLSNPTSGARLQQASTTVTIQDNDANPGQLRFTAATRDVSEAAATVQVDVERFGGSQGAVSVQYATSPGTASAGGDYTTTSGTLNWAAGDSSVHSFSIPIANDTIYEGDETFTVVLSNPGNGAVLGTPAVQTVTITNDDAVNGALGLGVASTTVAEGGQVTLQVTRTGGSGGPVQVDYATSNGDAVAPDDYTTANGTLSWAEGDTGPKTITVNTVDDATDEKAEVFYVTLSNVQGGASLGQAQATVSITDNDLGPTGTLAMSAQAVPITESVGVIQLAVTRTGGFSGPASVNFTTQDFTALAGSDYTAASGTLNWADGDDASKVIAITVIDDTADEPDEDFKVVLSGATGAALDGNATTTTVTLLDNDLPLVPGVLSVSGPGTVDENATAILFNVSRAGGADGIVGVSYATVAGTATSNVDYTATSGTLSWANGDLAAKTVSVPIIDDATDEPHETFALSLSSPTGGATLGTASAATTIIDNDVSGPGFLGIVANVQVFETVGTAVVSVQRTGGFDGAVSVNYATTSDSAVDGQDFTGVNGTLNWAAGDGGVKLINIPILNDTAPEALESFTVTLSGAGGGATIGQAVGAVVIRDDDVPGVLAFTQTSYVVAETAGTLVVSVGRSDGSKGAVSVDYATTAGSATAGSDYTTAAGTLNWADGDTANKTITVPILNDALVEFDETFTITLSGATGGASIGAVHTTTVTIQSDEVPVPGTVRMVSAAVSVSETAGTVNLSVERIVGSDGPVSIDYATQAGTATAGSDYTSTSGTLNWADGDTANKTITVPILNDAAYEVDETFAVNLSNPQGGAILASPSTTVTVQSEDAPIPGTLGLVATAVTVNETDGTATLSVTRTGGSDSAVSVSYATAYGTATAADFTATSGTLNWANGDAAAKTITVPLTNDTLYESNEAFTVTLSGATGGASLGAASATVTIVSDDPPLRGTLAMANATATVDENAGTIVLTVNRSGGTDGAVGVDWATATGTATTADFTPGTGTLSWADGDATPKTFAVTITDDTVFEFDETFTVTLSNATGGAALGAATTSVTIRSDEAPVSGTIRMAATAVSVDETAGTVSLTVERFGGSDNAVGVSYATATGTAGAGDFTATSGALSWAHGDAASKTITVPIIDDTRFEPDETFTVTLSSVTGGAALGTPTTTVTIVSTDPPQRGTLAMTAASALVAENLGSISLSVSRTGGSDGAVSVSYATATGTAGAADFTATSGTLTWADGDAATKSITVPITNDALYEPDEAFTVTLSGATGGATLGAATTTVTIVSEDAPQRGTLGLTATALSVNEAAGTVTLSVSRTGGTDGPVGVSYATTAGTASAADFTTTSGTLSWADGEAATKTFTVTITNDAVVEYNETFAVTLSNPSGGAVLGAASATVTITDDDILVAPGAIGLTQSAFVVSETSGTVTLTVERVYGLGGAVSVDYATVSGTATAGADFTAATGTLTWAQGDAANKTIVINLVDDLVMESDETFTVTLSNPGGGASLGTATATVTLQSNDDTVPNAFSFVDQTNLPVNAEVTSNPITVGGINAPAAISITGGEYSINGAAFTSAAGTVTNGAEVRVRAIASSNYSTTVSATLTIGGVSDTFSLTTKPPYVATTVKAKSGGGSFGGLGALMLGVLCLVRGRRRAVALASVLLGGVVLTPMSHAADNGVYVGAGGGTSEVSVGPGQVEQRLEDATGQSVTDIDLDETSTSYNVRVGYQWNPFVAVEAGYYDFGTLEAEVSAQVLDPEDFARQLAKSFPSNLHGPTLMAVVSWPYNNKLAAQLGLGAIAWSTDVDAKLVTGGTGTYHASDSGTEFVWSGRFLYRPTERVDLSLEYTQVELEDTVHAIQLCVGWRTGWLSR